MASKHDGLRYFVNRQPQLLTFAQLMQTPASAYLLFVHGAPGIGKSTLLRKLKQEHVKTNVNHATLDFENDELFTPEAVVNKLRDELGGIFATTISDALRQQEQAVVISAVKELAPSFTLPQAPPPTVSVMAKVEGVAEGGTVAVGSQIVQLVNPTINFAAGMGSAQLQSNREQELSEVVRAAFTTLAAQGPVLLFFDNCNIASSAVITWLCTKILSLVRQQRIQPNGAFIMALAGDIKSARGNLLRTLVDWHDGAIVYADELGNLAAADVKEYWTTHRQLAVGRIPPVYLELGVSPGQLVTQADMESLGGNGHG